MTKNRTAVILSRSLPILTVAVVLPQVLGAQDFVYLYTVLGALRALVGLLVPLLIALALILFIWGLVIFIARSGDEKAHEEGRRKMIWGVLALFVIISVWGLVALVQELTGVYGVEDIEPPQSYF